MSKRFAAGLLLTSLLFSAQAIATNPGFLPFQALITNTSDIPLTNMTFTGGTSMIIEILDNTNQCVVYEETIPTITTDSKGMAAWSIGTGAVSYAAGGPGSIQTVLTSANSYSVTSCLPGTAVVGTPQTVNLVDGRAIQFSVDNGATWSTATLITLGSVPYAFNADSLGGTPAANYVLTNGANPLTGNLNAAGFKVTGLANPSGAQDAVNLQYAQGAFAPISGNQNFGAGNIVTTGNIGVGTAAPAANVDIESAASDALIIGSLGAGATTMSLNFDANNGTTNRASIQSSANSNTLNFSTGGVMAMSIAANQTVTFNNSISSAGALALGSYLSVGSLAADPGVGTVPQGTFWENSVSHSMKYYDGTVNQLLVTGVSAGTGITLGGTAQAPIVNVAALGGDLSGTVTAANVAALQGKTLTIAAPSNGQVITYNAGVWSNQSVAGVPVLTAGSVVFSGGATTLSQDNTKFFWDDTNHRLGLNAGVTPGNTLDVNTPSFADPNAQTLIANTAVTNKALVLQEFVGQNTNMMEVQSSGGAKLYTVEWTGTPVANTDLTPKSYVDTVTTTSAGLYVRKDGTSTMTGTLNLGNQVIQNASQLGVGLAGAPASTIDMNGTMRFEGSTSGYVGFKSAATVATPVTWTLPPGDGAANQVLSTNGSGTLTWASGVTNFTGNLSGDVTGSQSATIVQAVGGSTAANLHADDLAVQGSTNNNTPSMIVRRDPSGNFSAGTITATLNGTANNVTGVVGVPNGGTGLTSVPTNGQLMIGNGAGYSLATLTGTANEITISNTPGNITLTTPQAIGTASNVIFANETLTGSLTSGVNGLNVGGIQLVAVGGNVGVETNTPNSNFQVQGSFATKIITVGSGYFISANDQIVTANASSGTFTLTLPSASGISGRQYTMKKIDPSINPVSIQSSSGMIDGLPVFNLNTAQQFVTVVSDGSNWNVIAGGNSSLCTRVVTNTYSVVNTFGSTININFFVIGGGGGGSGSLPGTAGQIVPGTLTFNPGNSLTVFAAGGGGGGSPSGVGGGSGGGGAGYFGGGGGGDGSGGFGAGGGGGSSAIVLNGGLFAVASGGNGAASSGGTGGGGGSGGTGGAPGTGGLGNGTPGTMGVGGNGDPTYGGYGGNSSYGGTTLQGGGNGGDSGGNGGSSYQLNYSEGGGGGGGYGSGGGGGFTVFNSPTDAGGLGAQNWAGMTAPVPQMGAGGSATGYGVGGNSGVVILNYTMPNCPL